MRLLPAAGRRAVPWKNGGGLTLPVATDPAEAGFDDFHWRVSIAEIGKPGPFSRFEGVDRALVVLAGRLRLIFDDRTVVLGPESEPALFPGEAHCVGAPLGGHSKDLNVMTRRGRASARLDRVASGSIAAQQGPALFVATAPSTVRGPREALRLEMHDAAFLEERFELLLNGAGILIVFSKT
ncbi:MAG TPA: HutD family protein [Rhizomicrobium sp.]|nr:HutD family protein [Rhizomicrobium sp.]